MTRTLMSPFTSYADVNTKAGPPSFNAVDRMQAFAKGMLFFLSFRRVLNVIYSFLGNSPASEI